MGSVSVNQLSALMDFLESNRELALGYCNRSKEGRSQARRLWEQCSTLLNSVSANCVQKTPDQWRLYYNEYKSKVLKKIKMEKAAMSATGGGPSSLKKLSPIQERLYNILGRDIGEPLPGVRHNPLITSQSQSGQASVEVVQIPLAENSQIAEGMVQMLHDNTDITHNSDAVLELPISEPELQLSGVGPSTSQEADRVLQPSTPTATPAPRQPLPTLRRRRRRAQRSPLEGIRSEYVTTQEASARLEAMERLSTEATREHAQATNRLAAALEAIAERLREPITIVLQNTPQTP